MDCLYDDSDSWINSTATGKPEKQSQTSFRGDLAYTRKLEMELVELRNKISRIESSISFPETATPENKSKVDFSNSYSLPPKHPHVNPTDTIDFYMRDNANSNYGTWAVTAFSWKTMVKKDPFIRVLWQKLVCSTERREIVEAIREKTGKPHVITIGLDKKGSKNRKEVDKDDINRPEETEFSEEASKNLDSSYSMMAKSLTKETLFSAAERDEKLKSVSESIAEAANPKYSQWRLTIVRPTTHEQLVKLILDKLPKKKVLWLLIDRFFKFAYPFMPFIDEYTFICKITKIIGERSMEETKITELVIDNKYEIAILGILLFLLEFGSFTLFSNSKSDTKPDEDFQYLLDNPIIQDNATLLKYCFVQFKFFRHVSLEILQLAIFKRLHMKYSPQEGDGTDASESQIFNGLLLQMAVSLGLNRDSDFLMNFLSYAHDFIEAPVIPDSLANLKRRIWHFIVMNDSYHTYVLSGPSTARIDFYDTALPHKPTQENKNSTNMETELFIYDSFKQHAKYDLIVKSFIYDMLSFKESNVISILLRLHHLEHEVSVEFKDFHHLLFKKYTSDNAHSNSLRKLFSTIQYIELKSLIYLVYYHIFLNYEASGANDELAFFYLQKALLISTDLTGSLFHFLTKSELYFGQGFDFLLTPTLELMFHKVIQLRYGFQYRLRQYESLYKLNTPYINVDRRLESVIKHLYYAYIQSVKHLLTITDRYYYAWKICKFQRICLILLLSNVSQSSDQYVVDPDQKKQNSGETVEAPPKSLLLRINQKKLLEFFDFMEDAVDAKRIDKVFDPNYEDKVDNFIFTYGHDVGHYLKKSSERTKPLKEADTSSSATNSTVTSPFSNFPIDPKIDKWWTEFLNNKSATHYSDIYGKTPNPNGGLVSGKVNDGTEKYDENANLSMINTAGSSYDLFPDVYQTQASSDTNDVELILGLDSSDGLGSMNWNDLLAYLGDDFSFLKNT